MRFKIIDDYGKEAIVPDTLICTLVGSTLGFIAGSDRDGDFSGFAFRYRTEERAEVAYDAVWMGDDLLINPRLIDIVLFNRKARSKEG